MNRVGHCASVPRRPRLRTSRRTPWQTTSGPSGLRERIARQGEDALGKLAQELLENPLVNSAITRAFDARERAAQAQEAAMGALNIPSAADVERLTRRLRSVSQRMEGIEEAVDRLDQRLAGLASAGRRPWRSGSPAIEGQLAKLATEISNLTRRSTPRRRCRASRSGWRSTRRGAEAEGEAAKPRP